MSEPTEEEPGVLDRVVDEVAGFLGIGGEPAQEPESDKPRLSDFATPLTGVNAPSPVRGSGFASEFRLKDVATPVGEPEPTTGEIVRTTGQGITKGVLRTSPMVTGAFMGGKIGAELGLLTGPGAPVFVPLFAGLGVVGGGVAGYKAGEALDYGASQITIPYTETPLTFENLQAVPKNLRPYAIGGKAFGESVPFAGAPYIAVREGIRFAPNLAGRILNNIIETSGRMPARFAAVELSAASGAGLGGGVMERAFPGNVASRIGGEVVGGIANPGRWIITLTRSAYAGAKTAIQAIPFFGSEASKLDNAARVVQDIIREAGESPTALAEALRARRGEIDGLTLTAGQTVQSPALLVLEAKLASEAGKFGAESKAMAEESIATIRTVLKALESSGNPQALRVAAQMRDDYFRGLLATRLHVAEQEALEAAGRIAPDEAGSVAGYGVAVGKIMDDAISEVRTVERELWGQVDKDLAAAAESILTRYTALKAERLPEEKLPEIVEGFITRMREGTATAAQKGNLPTTANELMIFRSRMLALSREAAAKNDWSDARVFGELAESALDDLAAVQNGDRAYDVARAFSFQLHDTFSRTFAGKALGTTRTGAPRVPPEFIMKRAFGAGREAGDLQFSQLEEAARMAGTEHLSRLLDQQERTIRFAAAEIIDTITGRVNPGRLAKFRANNRELLKRFPEVEKHLKDAESAELFLRSTERGGQKAQKAIQGKSAFAVVLKGEDPAVAVGRAVNGDNPVRDFQALARLAQRSGADAMEGFKASVFSHAYNRASGAGFSFAKYRASFDEPLITGGPTLKDLMLQNNVASKADMEVLAKYLDRAAEIENALAGREPLETILSAGDAMYDMVLRIAGASLAKVAPTGAAHPLIVASAGSRTARQVFDKVPKRRVRDFLVEASKDPEFMAALLERQVSPAEKIKVGRQINAYLWQLGITGDEQKEALE